jgi:hypothetical protein
MAEGDSTGPALCVSESHRAWLTETQPGVVTANLAHHVPHFPRSAWISLAVVAMLDTARHALRPLLMVTKTRYPPVFLVLRRTLGRRTL